MRSVIKGIGLISFMAGVSLLGCAGRPDLAHPPIISPGIEANSTETLSSVVRRHRALQQLPPSRLAQAVTRTKARFLKNPNLENYQQLITILALPNVPFPEKLAVLELMQQQDLAFTSTSTQDLHLVLEQTVIEAVQTQKRTRELTAAISDRDQKIAELERSVRSLVATRSRCYKNQASLERQLQYIQSWALKLRHQLDEIGRIEKSIEDRRQSTPLELPKQNDQHR